ncbi:MAG: hypothetical protein ACTHN5_04425 [Phycisphaerae bacterium]
MNWTASVSTGVAAHRWSVAELRTIWQHITNKRREGERQAAMAIAIRDGHKPRMPDQGLPYDRPGPGRAVRPVN